MRRKCVIVGGAENKKDEVMKKGIKNRLVMSVLNLDSKKH